MQASLRLCEIMEGLKSKDSAEYRSLKSLLKSKRSTEILDGNVAALDKEIPNSQSKALLLYSDVY